MASYLNIDKKMRLSRGMYRSRRRPEMPDLITKPKGGKIIKLDPPKDVKGVSLYEAICKRRSHREFHDKPLTLEQLSKLLYFSAGVTATVSAYSFGEYVLRAYPTAGALNSVEVYISVRNVEGLEKGLYRYIYTDHSIELLKPGDVNRELYRACLDQEHVRDAPINIALTARIDRTYWKYGDRAYKYVHWDAGHASQNFLLVAESLGMKSCVVGAYFDEEVCKVLGIDCEKELPMLIIPIGFATLRDRDYVEKCPK